MSVIWTIAQKQRLLELGATPEVQNQVFREALDRDEYYQQLEFQLVSQNKHALREYKNSGVRPLINQLESYLEPFVKSGGILSSYNAYHDYQR